MLTAGVLKDAKFNQIKLNYGNFYDFFFNAGKGYIEMINFLFYKYLSFEAFLLYKANLYKYMQSMDAQVLILWPNLKGYTLLTINYKAP